MIIENINKLNERAFDFMFVEKLPAKYKIDFLIYHRGQAENDEDYRKLFDLISRWSVGAIDYLCSCEGTIEEFKWHLNNMGFPAPPTNQLNQDSSN
ncbi:mediator of RNA polymerase II transcription subunit 18 [Patescibacteria group bacterium]|nr:mediator of RNA polymerase II transcription subunit 18 [Patescibacteria group bacterium]